MEEPKKHCYWCGGESSEEEVLLLQWDKHANSIRESKVIKPQYESCWICSECLRADDYKEDFAKAVKEGFIDV